MLLSVPNKKQRTFNLSPRRFTILASTTVALGGLLFGYDTAVISGAILFVRRQFHLSLVQTELAVSIVLAGAFFGACVGGYLGDRFGRKPVLTLTALIYGVFAVATGMANGLPVFLVARLLVGFAVGISSMITPLYISEISPANIRGALVTLNQVAITTGVVVAFYSDYLFASAGNWRAMFITAVGPSLMLLIGLLFLPESPRWLVTRKRFEEGWQTLTRLENIPEAKRDFHKLRHIAERSKLSLWDLLAPRFRKPILVGVGLAIFQQITGVNTIVYYAPTIFQMVGFRTTSAILATASIGGVGLAATILSMFLLDRVGRRPLLLASVTAMGLCLVQLAFMLGATRILRTYVVIDVIVYLASFSIGLGPVFWLLISEIYPTTIRAQAMSLATITIWASDFLMTVTFLTLVQHLGMRNSFLLYAALCGAAAVFCFRTVPETRGRTLEDIETWDLKPEDVSGIAFSTRY